MAQTKVNKDYVMSDSSLNVYGMRLLTSGYKMEEFTKNPIGYYGHKKDDGVLLKWEDVRMDGDKVIGKPVINMEHPRADRTLKEIEDGFLNAASVGKLVILEAHLEDNPEDAADPILVVDSWYHKECSLVDNPGNRNAMKVELYDGEDNEVNLSDLINYKFNKGNMKKITLELTPKLLGLLNLSDDKATAEAVVEGIEGLHTENATLTTKLDKAKKDLADDKAAAVTARVKGLLDKAEADKKLFPATRLKLENAFATKPDELSDLLGDMPVISSVTANIDTNNAGNAKKVKELSDKTWKELDLADELEDLKKYDLPTFKEKYKEHFKKDYKE